MPTYQFQAKGMDGRVVQGDLQARNEAEARIRLRAQRLMPLKLAKIGGTKEFRWQSLIPGSDSVSQKDLQVFTRQFAVLVAAGVPIVQSLEAMSRGARSLAMTNILRMVTGDVEKGRRLADSLANQPAVFDRLYVNLVRSGEEAGALETVLDRLAIYIEKSVKLKGKVKSALVYPAVIIVVAIVVVSFILIFVVPKIAEMFTQSGGELPMLTVMVIAASQMIQKFWYLGVGILIGGPVIFKMYYETPPGRKIIDTLLIEMPILGDLIKKAAIARLSRTLATLLSSGVRIVDALEISATTTGNVVIEESIQGVKDAVLKGRTLADPLTKNPYFPPMVTQMISIGEQTGNLDQMLVKVADFYEDEVDNATGAITSLIEPLLMVFLGGIIAVIVIAMYLPIFNMANVIQGQ